MKTHLYSGAGNSFVIIDGRGSFTIDQAAIVELCAQNGTDGLMVLRDGDGPDAPVDFRMEYYNSDGSGGMMCGNGGRCIVAFADYLGIVPADGKLFRFLAADGLHTGEILQRKLSPQDEKIVRLKMIDVREFRPSLDEGWFVDTGTRHYVKFVDDVEALDVDAEGRRYRWDPEFAPIGANANFVSPAPGFRSLKVRTFEKGVEAETLACGTGITASAIASYLREKKPGESGPVKYDVRAREADLSVEFEPRLTDSDSRELVGFDEVYLTGPATRLSRS